MIFVPLWITFSYTIGAFSIWAGGFLFKLGVIDYSGGYVIHLSSGTAGFVGAFVIGPRSDADRQDKRPNNTLLVLVGAGILWIGWNGFNGGDPVSYVWLTVPARFYPYDIFIGFCIVMNDLVRGERGRWCCRA